MTAAADNLHEFRFIVVADKVIASTTEFRRIVRKLESAQGHQLTNQQKWDAAMKSISLKSFQHLRLAIKFHPETGKRNYNWLLQQATEFVEDKEFIAEVEDLNKEKGLNNTNAAFAVTDTERPSAPSTNDALAAAVLQALSAITTGPLTTPRGPNKPKKFKQTKFDQEPPRDCKFCPGERHWHKDCPKLRALENSAKSHPARVEKMKLAAAKDFTSGKGFLFGAKVNATARRRPGLLQRVSTTAICNPLVWLLTTLSGSTWLNIMILLCMTITVATTSASAVNSSVAALAARNGGGEPELPPPVFMVDSGASEHICGNIEYFQNLNPVSKVFDVVHGESIKSIGTGTIELIAKDDRGEWSTLTLQDVHYIPDQPMSLISVSKAIANPGVSNPDFVNNTWSIGDKTFDLIGNNGTFTLKAHPAPSVL